ncbi:hypothetical protein IFM89_034813 [Coptis chinensis]|uniref:Uncharacterized protein n=1 Tax=Coptis chinensis TaxID=261450 RepID=A0A835H743_9MAGN|nr:hypothetical protein IFM89_034813 [Coptis chinensis]
MNTSPKDGNIGVQRFNLRSLISNFGPFIIKTDKDDENLKSVTKDDIYVKVVNALVILGGQTHLRYYGAFTLKCVGGILPKVRTGLTAFFDASSLDYLSATVYLLEEGANTDTRSYLGFTPLHTATSEGPAKQTTVKNSYSGIIIILGTCIVVFLVHALRLLITSTSLARQALLIRGDKESNWRIQQNHRFLVFENSENGSLKDHHNDPLKTPLSWRTRMEIAIGVAAALVGG